MSATNRGAERQPEDFYATPAPTVRALLRHYDVKGKRVLEPGCGTGSILRELVAAGAHAVGIELDAGRAARAAERSEELGFTVACADYLGTQALAPADRFDFAIGNPPFSLALPFVQKSLTQAHTVCMLLRLSWLGSKERAAFHEQNPSHVRVLDTRPTFVASLKCKGFRDGNGRFLPCGWRIVQPLESPRPGVCPDCAGNVSVTTTDATEYAWFCFEPARRAEWSILRV